MNPWLKIELWAVLRFLFVRLEFNSEINFFCCEEFLKKLIYIFLSRSLALSNAGLDPADSRLLSFECEVLLPLCTYLKGVIPILSLSNFDSSYDEMT